MLFPELSAPVSAFFTQAVQTADVFIVFCVGFFDQEIGAVLAGLFSREAVAQPFALIAAAFAAGLLRAALLFEAAARGTAAIADDPQSHTEKLRIRLRHTPFLWIAGLQCCFAFRWTLPVLCANFRIGRLCFYGASAAGLAAWCGALAFAARFWLDLVYPGLLGRAEASRVMLGLTVAAIVAVIGVKAVSRRWAERLQSNKRTSDNHENPAR